MQTRISSRTSNSLFALTEDILPIGDHDGSTAIKVRDPPDVFLFRVDCVVYCRVTYRLPVALYAFPQCVKRAVTFSESAHAVPSGFKVNILGAQAIGTSTYSTKGEDCEGDKIKTRHRPAHCRK